MKSWSHSNRGKTLELYIDHANAMYEHRGQGVIVRQHPEVKATKVDGKRILSGFFKDKGAPDYIGLASGVSICFDAKETKVKTNFPLKNIKSHQVKYLKQWDQQGGLSFLIIHFTTHKEVYLFPYKALQQSLNEAAAAGAKSIPYKVIQERGRLIKPGDKITLDWLSTAWEARE
ncbi:Holliday junction resolvase RecU [Jeotgalibacillus haloalkalitolerans]|uniref:Holliday junction resolvase RecU n=1 Tax=Jeotgalibacillus haloalkalitolerans TaxID=3104292 RepID=A0ABU5KLX5_9BACL|nr:Holliday junction resolvase RecU [Jeotgalibacillus sp. HH7-29]MDZ5712267.1 Holliday junction resolvase RecU [Jeotgalibacillus sp. HH7-29]